MNGHTKSERRDTLAQSLADAREHIQSLEREEQALLMAEETVSSAVREDERQARAQAGDRLLSACQQEVKKLKTLVEQARGANERLLKLDRPTVNGSPTSPTSGPLRGGSMSPRS